MGKLVDLSGKRFGKLMAIERSKAVTGHGKHAHWKCVCDCGTILTVRSNLLRTGNTRSCGCLARAKDLTNKIFGKLVVIKREGARRQRVADHFCTRCGTAYHPRYENERGNISR